MGVEKILLKAGDGNQTPALYDEIKIDLRGTNVSTNPLRLVPTIVQRGSVTTPHQTERVWCKFRRSTIVV